MRPELSPQRTLLLRIKKTFIYSQVIFLQVHLSAVTMLTLAFVLLLLHSQYIHPNTSTSLAVDFYGYFTVSLFSVRVTQILSSAHVRDSEDSLPSLQSQIPLD